MTKSILIIGAGPGIGLSVARKFGEQGWSIVLSARNPEQLAALTADLSARGITVQTVLADASDRTALRAAIAEADRITGGLTAIHYNAAALRAQDLFSMTGDEIEQNLAVNVASGLHAIRAAASQFGARGGTILVTGGGLALTRHAGYASLGLGKAALRNVVQALAHAVLFGQLPGLFFKQRHQLAGVLRAGIELGMDEAAKAGVGDGAIAAGAR